MTLIPSTDLPSTDLPSTDLTGAAAVLTDAAGAFNAATRYTANLPVTVTVTGAAVTLRSDLRRETFTLTGNVLTGRGGTFDLDDHAQRHLVLTTVQPTEPAPGFSTLAREAARLGLRVRVGRAARWKYVYTATPIHLIHPDGRVVWLAEFVSDDLLGGNLRLIASGWPLLARQHTLDEELLSLMRQTDEQTAQDVADGHYPAGTVPDEIPVSRWPLRGASLAALLAAQTPDPADLVPGDFHLHPERYVDPAATITRASLRAPARAGTPTLDALAAEHFGGDQAATRALLSALTCDVLRAARTEQHQ